MINLTHSTACKLEHEVESCIPKLHKGAIIRMTKIMDIIDFLERIF
jgi:hypothetical protein